MYQTSPFSIEKTLPWRPSPRGSELIGAKKGEELVDPLTPHPLITCLSTSDCYDRCREVSHARLVLLHEATTFFIPLRIARALDFDCALPKETFCFFLLSSSIGLLPISEEIISRYRKH